MGADSGIKQGEVVPWADPRAELEDIKAEGLRGQQTVDGALARLSAFTASEGKWGHGGLGYATVAGFLQAECPWLAELAIPVSPRREIVALMAAQETSQREIAAALGVSQPTVNGDLRVINVDNPRSGGENVTPRNAGVPLERSANASRQARHRERTRQGAAHPPDCQCGACQSARPDAYKLPVSAGEHTNGSSGAEDGKPHVHAYKMRCECGQEDKAFSADFDALEALAEKKYRQEVARLGAEVARLQDENAGLRRSGGSDGSGETDPGDGTDLDSGGQDYDQGAGDQRPCGSPDADRVVLLAGGKRRPVPLDDGTQLEWLCPLHQATLAATTSLQVKPAPGAGDLLPFELEPCQFPVPAEVAAHG